MNLRKAILIEPMSQVVKHVYVDLDRAASLMEILHIEAGSIMVAEAFPNGDNLVVEQESSASSAFRLGTNTILGRGVILGAEAGAWGEVKTELSLIKENVKWLTK